MLFDGTILFFSKGVCSLQADRKIIFLGAQVHIEGFNSVCHIHHQLYNRALASITQVLASSRARYVLLRKLCLQAPFMGKGNLDQLSFYGKAFSKGEPILFVKGLFHLKNPMFSHYKDRNTLNNPMFSHSFLLKRPLKSLKKAIKGLFQRGSCPSW